MSPPPSGREAQRGFADTFAGLRGDQRLKTLVGLLILALIFVALLFPPLNWPDERRNVGLLERGDYGLFYGPFQKLFGSIFQGFGFIGPYDALAQQVTESSGWRYFNGALRYATLPGDGNAAYYSAKLGNIVIVLCSVAIFWSVATATKGRKWGGASTTLYVTSLTTPAVVYQSLQVSTDLLFILMSVGLFFIETKKFQIAYSALSFILVIEDRSFAILGFIAVLLALLPTIVNWRAVACKPATRTAFLLFFCGTGIALGKGLSGSLLNESSDWMRRLASVPGFDGVSSSVEYTQSVNYSLPISPILGLAGLVYLPSAAEFFLFTTPLYVLGAVVAWRMISISVRDVSQDGKRFFYLLGATVLVFFSVTGATHVFESGRYYFTLMPMMVLSLASLIHRRKPVYRPPANVTSMVRVSGYLLAINVVGTLLIVIGALMNS